MPYDAPPEGNDWGAFASSQPGSLPVSSELSGFAHLSLPNVFTDVNTFAGGIRFAEKTVTTNYTITHNDYEILVDASGGAVVITLPLALGDGQLYRIKKIDSSGNTVTVVPQSGDLIDGSTGIFLTTQWDATSLIDASLNYWDKVSDPLGTFPADVARKGLPNVFTDLNTFTGIRVATQTVTTDTTLTTLDYETLVDATLGPVTVTLPPSTGSGQQYRVKKIDASANIVTVAADGSDLIDGSISLNFFDQYADCTLVDAALGYWDNTGSASTGSGGSVTSADLASVESYLSLRIDTASGTGGGGSVTSQEISVLVQTASAAATSADAHANTVSARVVSASAELASLVQIASAAATSADAHANTASAAATSADAHANTVSARVVSVSAELGSLVQIASAAATSADNHANTVSQRVVSVSAELGSLLASASAALEAHINAVSAAGVTGGASVTSQEVSVLVQTASAAATSADAHANTVSGRVVSVSAELASLLASASTTLETHIVAASAAATSADAHANTASAAATSADNHANTVSARVVSVSAELMSQLASTSAALEAHINAVSAAGATGSVTSQEVSVLVQTASAAATSADAHANTVSARVVSVSAELASLLASASAALEAHASAASGAATSADAHANTVSARVVSVSAELASLIQIASAAATSADGHANTVSAAANVISARVVSVSAELASLVQIASAAATSADGHANTVSARAVSISAELASLVQIASAAATSAINKAVSDNTSLSAVIMADVASHLTSSLGAVSVKSVGGTSVKGLQSVVNTLSDKISIASAAATSADAHANTVSARVVSVSAELASLLASASANLKSIIAASVQVASAAATSADGHANTVSARVVSVSAELASLVQIASAAATSADAHANTVSAAANTISARVVSVSAELASLVQIASAAATSADGHANTVSTRAVSISAELASLIQGYSTFSIGATSVLLSAGSPPEEFATGATGGTILMPDVTTLVLGKQYLIKNNSSAAVVVNSSGGNLIISVPAGKATVLTCILTTGTTAASWDYTIAGDIAVDVVSARLVSVSAELASLLASVESRLSTRIDTASGTGGGGSVTSQEVSVLVQTASAAATSADAHANTVSAQLVSVSAALTSALNLVSINAAAALSGVAETLSNKISITSAAATSADGHANTVSARVVSVSAELVSLIQGYSTIATAGASTVLTSASPPETFFTGVTTQTVVMPVTSTLVLGQQFLIKNNSTGAVTINSSGSNLIATLATGQAAVLTCILTSGTTAASWDAVVGGNIDAVSARVVSVSAELGSLVQIASAAATSAINKAVSDNTSLSAVIKTDINSVSAAIKTDIASVSAAIKTDIASVSAAIKTDTASMISDAMSVAIGMPQFKRITTAAQAIATGTLTKVSGLSISCVASGFYQIEGQLVWSQSGAGSASAIFQFGMQMSAQPLMAEMMMIGNVLPHVANPQVSAIQFGGASAICATASIMYSSKPQTGASGCVANTMHFDGIIQCSTAQSQCKIMAAASTGAFGIAIQPGSYVRAYRIG